jgi:hypothetical protein
VTGDGKPWFVVDLETEKSGIVYKFLCDGTSDTAILLEEENSIEAFRVKYDNILLYFMMDFC